ncbi:MAG TPA: nuclear transport factor 2 family protein [Thermoplasmata archaeon]|nr:nuclear transport factor 2 family protein [Thermoplasmata archaeon]
MPSAKEVVASYQEAMGKGDWKRARSHLKDDLTFRGPLDTFSRADDYVAALQKLYPMVEAVDVKGVFSERDQVVILCDLRFKPPMPTMYVVEWYTVTGEKISRVQVVFDPRPMAGAMGTAPHG